MKKIQGNKLALNRETLAPLQRDELAGVNGGLSLPTSIPTISRIRTLCPTTTLTGGGNAAGGGAAEGGQ